MKKIVIISLGLSSIVLCGCFGKKPVVNTDEYKIDNTSVVQQTGTEAKQTVEKFLGLMKQCKIKESVEQCFLSGETYYQILQQNAKNKDLDQECILNMGTGINYKLENLINNPNDDTSATAEITLERGGKNSNMSLQLKKIQDKWFILDKDSKYGKQTQNLEQTDSTVLTGN